jgi:hypothetical protein
VDRKDPLDALELDENCTFDQEIDPVSAIQEDVLVAQWQRNLPLVSDFANPEFMRQAFLVRRLEQAWPERSVDLDRCPNHTLRDPSLEKHSVFSVTPW